MLIERQLSTYALFFTLNKNRNQKILFYFSCKILLDLFYFMQYFSTAYFFAAEIYFQVLKGGGGGIVT